MKVSHREDDHEVTKISYKKVFKLSDKFIKENDKIKNLNLYLKDYLEFLEKSNATLKFEISNIRNSAGICKTSVSMKMEGADLHETLSKFTKGK